MTRWLDIEQQRQWRNVITGANALFGVLNQELEAHTGLSLSEYEILVRLSEAPKHTLRMSALASSLVHSRSRITHMVRRLESRGIVARVANCEDGRGVDCVMTPEGLAVLEAAAPIHVESVRSHLVDVITPEQLASMGEAFGRVGEAAGAT